MKYMREIGQATSTMPALTSPFSGTISHELSELSSLAGLDQLLLRLHPPPEFAYLATLALDPKLLRSIPPVWRARVMRRSYMRPSSMWSSPCIV
jgi:hypothetical protein